MATNNAINQATVFPEFRVTLSAITGTVTGDGTVYKIAFDNIINDTMSNFSVATYEFSAPITAKYFLSANAFCHSIAAGQTDSYISIVTTARTYRNGITSPFTVKDSAGDVTLTCYAIADMTAGDTAYVNVCILNGAKVNTLLYTSAEVPKTFFTGYLIR